MSTATTYPNLKAIAHHLRKKLEEKKFILLYAYNGTGKTRLSTAFKDIGKVVNTDDETEQRDTLYFNAFTEDLFTWNNDLEYDQDRFLILNTASRFFEALEEYEVETRIRTILDRYADFDFEIILDTDTENGKFKTGRIVFSRDVLTEVDNNPRLEKIEGIKVSRSEESIFVWCFFVAILQLAIDPDIDAYKWVKYLYIDDPISSLDDQNAVQVAVHLVNLLRDATDSPGVVISTHHPLFYNVLWNELRGEKCRRLFLGKESDNDTFVLRDTGATPFFYHISALIELYKDAKRGHVEKRHYNTLRAIAEKAISFHGYERLEDCIQDDGRGFDAKLHRRFLNLYSHGGYSHFESSELLDEDKKHFHDILDVFLRRFRFNPKYFESLATTEPVDRATE